ncbi:TPA: MBL fold metallo-hydrolase [Bacillus cereus]|nr:MBL fold metallo-hydrolase [Bacillus cereus]HDR8354439.1 MBL fold metallo-hydrolase [Bacillus cereus]HDR8360139.1 MBL fold metallo-hydrolase [Bacillus cereus]HDR8381064.1 MBL fold metallo-hydrolase [Bacillus cereus]
MLTLKVLPAFNGDCLLISFQEGDVTRNILIDGGIRRTYPRHLRKEIEKIIHSGQSIDLLIVTHIDDDHIGGIIELFRDSKIDKTIIKKVWFNSFKTISNYYPEINIEPLEVSIDFDNKMGVRDGNTLEKALSALDCWEKQVIHFNKKFIDYKLFNSKITVLSPLHEGIVALEKLWESKTTLEPKTKQDTKMARKENDYKKSIEDLLKNRFSEDKSISNRSSISILFEYQEKKLLLLGDSHPTDIIYSLNRLGYNETRKLKIDFVKLSHHASKKNTSVDLLKIIECKNFIICTDGSKHNLPNKESLSRVIDHFSGVNLYFNYKIYEDIFTEEEMKTHNFVCYPITDLEV